MARTLKSMPFYISTNKYVSSAVGILLSKIIAMIAGILLLWLTNRILTTPLFAAFIVTYTAMSMIAVVISSGFEWILLYKASGLENRESVRLLGACLFLSVMLGILISIVLYFGAGAISYVFGKNEYRGWVEYLCPIVPVDIARNVIGGWYRSRKKILHMALIRDIIPHTLICVLLAAAWKLDAGPAAVAVSLFGAYAAPLLSLGNIRPLSALLKVEGLSMRDLLYGTKMMFSQVINQQQRRVDILFAGALLSSETTAAYSVASRLSFFLLFGKQLVTPLLAPRLRTLLIEQNRTRLAYEYQWTRFIGIFICLSGVLMYVIFGPMILDFFGDYASAYPVFLFLSAAMLLRTSTGANGEYLAMSGHAGWNLFGSAITLLFLVLFIGIRFSHLTDIHLAVAVTAGSFCTQLILTVVIWKTCSFSTVDISTGITTLLTLGVLSLGGFSILSRSLLIPILCGITGYYVFSNISLLQKIVFGLLRTAGTKRN